MAATGQRLSVAEQRDFEFRLRKAHRKLSNINNIFTQQKVIKHVAMSLLIFDVNQAISHLSTYVIFISRTTSLYFGQLLVLQHLYCSIQQLYTVQLIVVVCVMVEKLQATHFYRVRFSSSS